MFALFKAVKRQAAPEGRVSHGVCFLFPVQLSSLVERRRTFSHGELYLPPDSQHSALYYFYCRSHDLKKKLSVCRSRQEDAPGCWRCCHSVTVRKRRGAATICPGLDQHSCRLQVMQGNISWCSGIMLLCAERLQGHCQQHFFFFAL